MLTLRSYFTNRRTTNFYYSFLFLSRERRRAIEAVYAFARRGDDLADGHLSPQRAKQALTRHRSALDECYRGQAASVELQALAESIARYRIPREHFDDLLRGLEMDLDTTCYNTFQDLALYCYRVASTIGLIIIEILGYKNPRAREYAVNLGLALQLVNILRDLQSDARRGRIYLPREDMERFGVPYDVSRLAAGCYDRAFARLMEFESHRARHYFQRTRQLLPPEDRRSLVAAEIMAAIYWRLLCSIEARAYNIFGERVRVPLPVRFWTALSVYLGAEWHK